jgi:hypothetical protein
MKYEIQKIHKTESIDGYRQLTPVDGGHMNYLRAIAETVEGERLFIKHHDHARFTEALRAHHSRQYLVKEHTIYQWLTKRGYQAIPRRVRFDGERTLSMEPFEHHIGWYWRAPTDKTLQGSYIRDVLTALQDLSHQSSHNFPSFLPDINRSHPTLHREGWGCYLAHQNIIQSALAASPLVGSDELNRDLPQLFRTYISTDQPELNALSHHDLRQSNVAWHPTHGVRIVDWSWADTGTPYADTTSFLIDLAKSGIDIAPYAEYFDPRHALLLIGFWLEHHAWPTQTPDRRVREHQLASAITAHRLVSQLTSSSVDAMSNSLR